MYGDLAPPGAVGSRLRARSAVHGHATQCMANTHERPLLPMSGEWSTTEPALAGGPVVLGPTVVVVPSRSCVSLAADASGAGLHYLR